MQQRGATKGRWPVAAISCAAVTLATLVCVSATGAERSSIVVLESFSVAVPPVPSGVSGDGSTVFGRARMDDSEGTSLGIRPAKWNASGAATPLAIAAGEGLQSHGTALAASFDGSTIVGQSDEYEEGADLGVAARRWSFDGSGATLPGLDPNGQANRLANAWDVSADGSVVCGFALRYDPASHLPNGRDAIRWDGAGVATSLASPGEPSVSRIAEALTVSGDGTTIGGFARKFVANVSQGDRPVLWSANGDVIELPLSTASVPTARSGAVNALSFDGTRAFGIVDSAAAYRADEADSSVAVLWTNAGEPIEIGPRAAFGDSPPYSDRLVGCSDAGDRAVGYANLLSGPRGFLWTEGQGTVELGTLYRDAHGYVGTSIPTAISADGSTVVGTSSDAVGAREAFVWRNGQMRSLGDELQASGVDLAVAGWQSFDEAIACSSDGSVIVGIGRFDGNTVAFRAKINEAPTLTAPAPVSVECEGDQNLVELSVTANDANSADRLTVIWKVDGVVKETDSAVVPGSTATFRHDYPDGLHSVAIEVTDGAASGTAGTTVTVVDTTAPTIVVAADRMVPTDPGKPFASGVTLTPPVVADLCDGDPLLTNDAPVVFPLGQTVVKWTAVDDDGNVAVATQRVTVQDREKPQIQGPGGRTVLCDRGQPFATISFPPATASDNVPQGLKIVSPPAKRRYPIGKSTATWIVTDAAGNRSVWSATVTVRNRPPVANAGKSLVVTTASERGAKVWLDGRRSSDPDGHSLTYRWSAPGVRIPKPTVARTSANFPVGTKTVKLTVTDEAGAKKTASVRVTVRLKNAKRRPRGAAANAVFEQATQFAGTSSTSPSEVAAAVSYAAAAHRLGIELGDHVRWEEGQSPDTELLRYAELRELQRRYGQLAARRFLAAFAQTGDEASLLAGQHALRGVAHAAEDLTER